MIPIIGYADKMTVAPGDAIAFKISAVGDTPYAAKLVRLISGDANPDSPGVQMADLPSAFEGAYPSRFQRVSLGSFARAPVGEKLRDLKSFTLSATVWPTMPDKPAQGVAARLDAAAGIGFALSLGPDGATAQLGLGDGKVAHISVGRPLTERRWARIWCSYDTATGRLSVGQAPVTSETGVDDAGEAALDVGGSVAVDAIGSDFLIASLTGDGPETCFNGKIERPILHRGARAAEHAAKAQSPSAEDVVAAWDFSQGISSLDVIDAGPLGLHGRLINLPSRAMTGSNWSGEEMSWRHRPQEYGAIHFHDDDIEDCKWQTDFTFEIPEGMKSGVYAAHVTTDNGYDTIPFVVRPAPGAPQAKFCLVMPTFTYVIYANHARESTTAGYLAKAKAWGARPWTSDTYPGFGLSTYNYHTDGSGISHTTRHRPILNMRPGFLSIPNSFAVSGVRHLPADLHVIQWLESKGIDYDVVTDEDLDRDGVAAIQGYKAVATMSHPEYHTPESLNAFRDYAHVHGGRLLYLGGNGFYWRIARHPELEGVYEIRRAEDGIRAWAAEPGEYWNAFDGAYGGLWRRNGKPPQTLAGVGFTSQGMFQGSYYRRTPASYEDENAWIFKGVEDEIIGDFGFFGGGAAGYELDRADPKLGTPPNAVTLASSENHQDHFVLVHEEQLTHIDTVPRAKQKPGGRPEELIRADIVYFETPKGGAVFSVGSITFCGSLAWNGGDNNVSRMTENVIRHFLAD